MKKTSNSDARSPLNIKDTSAHTQRSQVVSLIIQNQSMSTPELRQHGIMQPASRILELKERGYKIEKVLETYTDGTGKTHHGVARYYFSSNPPAAVNNGKLTALEDAA
ncbi:MAG: hypothetical protein Alis3KO_26290 [Aliiglaciecola sp.]